MLTLLAQTYDYSGDAAAGAAGAAFLGGFVILWIIIGLLFLAFFIWWIFLLIDCINRDFPEKSTWLIILIVGLIFSFVWLVDLLYYFMVVKKYGKIGGGGKSTPPVSTPPATPPATPEQK